MENQEQSTFEKFNNWVRQSITIRLISIGILILLLLIPSAMVQDLIKEREYRREAAKSEISSKWGEIQTLSGPILSIPFYRYYKNEKDQWVKTIDYAHFLPESQNVKGTLSPNERKRGIYKIIVYNTKLQFSGEFKQPDFGEWEINDKDILWENAFVSFGIPDMKGVQKNVHIKWNQKDIEFNPGLETKDVLASGITTKVPLAIEDSSVNYAFEIDLDINGSNELNFLPIGKETNVNLKSSWPSPSFDGQFLPDERKVTNDGFTAKWNVLHVNRNYPQQWTGNLHNIYDSIFGVKLILPVDEYQKADRSAKYAVMFIAFTFLIFFFIEIINKKRIHPIQFILVGLALCIFYALLIALSEHIHFNYAYIISSLAIIGLISAYTLSVFDNKKLTLFMTGVLVVLYAFIFIILQLEDYALLMGSIGLFIVLATVMYQTRKIDWYNIGKSKK
ncbi:MAG: cell envelope integrity protein CreD [Vicingaceae bacterium]